MHGSFFSHILLYLSADYDDSPGFIGRWRFTTIPLDHNEKQVLTYNHNDIIVMTCENLSLKQASMVVIF